MPLLTAQQIIDADDILHEDVPCPEWGGDVRIKMLDGNELDAYRREYKEANDAHYSRGFCEDITGRELFLSHVCCDESGGRLFNASQVEALGKKSCKALERLYSRALALNYPSTEELRKNSSTGESGGTDTPGTST